MKRKCIVMILPPDPPMIELTKLIRELNLRYNASEALEYRGHITLKSFGSIDFLPSVKALEELSKLAETPKPFILHMGGLRFYGSREDIPGIYIPVEGSPELFDLHKMTIDILGKYSDGKDRSFKELDNWNPHFTIVGPDIDSKNLERAKKELHREDYSYSFPVDEITFYMYEEGAVKPPTYTPIQFMPRFAEYYV